MKKSHADKTSLSHETFILTLYISGTSPNSLRAINNITSICEKYIKGKYLLDIIDVYQEQLLAKDEQLIALPLLLKKSPEPQVKLIGDLSETKKVLKLLGINE
jgi:circadian clock protein KaiB